MIKFAQYQTKERTTFFVEVASRRNLTELIVEKDFWSCFILNRLFSIPKIKRMLIFKGGTSLSKVYEIINRFSDDIDLTIHPNDLDYDLSRLPEKGTSNTMRKNYHKELKKACDEKIIEIQALLEKDIVNILGEIKSTRKYFEFNEEHSSLLFYYPTQQQEDGGYIKPQIRLEIGSHTGTEPNEIREVKSWVAEEFPDSFEEPNISLIALKPERTFWEKATILHAEYHRPKESTMRNRLSRDYYDLYQMAQHDSGQNAMNDLKMLDEVAKHKNCYFYSKWAKYSEAKVGTLHLYPPQHRIAELEKDFKEMKEMFFKNPPSFDNLLSEIKKIEHKINKV